MAVRRFYCPDLASPRVELHADDAQHARKVLRLAAGHTVELFDGQGTLAIGRIEEIGRRCLVEVTERRRVEPLTPRIDIAAAMPKGARADVMVEKLSELGADRLTTLVTERSVVEPRQAKMERFGRMAVESAKQCGRAWLMQIAGPRDFADVVGQADQDVKLIADVQDLQPRVPLASKLKGQARVLVLVGPEGGWTDAERRTAREAGFAVWCFAPHVLRVETAAIAAVACLRSGTFD